METYSKNNFISSYVEKVDSFFKNLFEGTKPIRDIKLFNDTKIIDSLPTKSIIKEEIFSCFFKLIKKELLKRGSDKLKNTPPTLGNIKYYYRKLVDIISKSGAESIEDKELQIFGNLFFHIINKNYPLKNEQKTLEASTLEKFLIHEALYVLDNKNNNNNPDKKNDFIKLNHLLFYTTDTFQNKCLHFFLVINEFINEIESKFSNYNEFVINFYYLYYKYSNKENISEFKEKILAEIDPYNFSKFTIDNDSLNDNYIEKLTLDFDTIANNNKQFQLNVDKNLLNNKTLLKLFNLKEIDIKQIQKFFRFHFITKNYLKYALHKEKNFEISVDDLYYKRDKLHVFNIFFLIACGLADKIDKDSLQIFNDDNKVIMLFKKYGEILLDNINKIIMNIKNESNIIPNDNENFGFGKIFNSFYVLYSDLNDDKYQAQELKFNLIKNSDEINNGTKKVAKIKIITNKSEKNTNFSRISGKSKLLNDSQIYHEKINSYCIEESCKSYILSQITDLIEENIYNIELIELYKILFSVNFFIPFIDENYCLKFLPIAKNFDFPNIEEYGYQEFDFMFKVNSEEDIPLNSKKNANGQLPFVKSNEINITSINKSGENKFKINFDNDKEFSIKKNSLVIVENKTKFPQERELLIQYITVMLKKLNFIIKLLKNTSNNIRTYENIQLLLIYDELIYNSEQIKILLDENDIIKILTDIPFSENANFTIEIIYMSQIINFYNISKMNDRMKKMNELIKNLYLKMDSMTEEINKLKRYINSNGLKLPEGSK